MGEQGGEVAFTGMSGQQTRHMFVFSSIPNGRVVLEFWMNL